MHVTGHLRSFMPDFIGIINTVHFGSLPALPHYDCSFAQGEMSNTMLEYIYNEIRKRRGAYNTHTEHRIVHGTEHHVSILAPARDKLAYTFLRRGSYGITDIFPDASYDSLAWYKH